MPWDGTAGAATIDINGITYMKAYKNNAGETVYINDNIVDENNLKGINLSNIGGTATPTTQIAFGANLPSGANMGSTYSVSTLIYDSLGNPSNISLEYTKESANSWGLATSIPSGAAAINMYTDKNLVFSSIAQMEFTDIPAIGSTITITGDAGAVTFEFTNGNQPTAGNVAVDMSTSNSVKDVLTEFVSVIGNNIRDGGRFTVDANRIVVEQSLTGDKLQFDCSGTLACVQSSANIDQASGLPSGTFTLDAINNSIKNCAYVDFNQISEDDTIVVDGITFIFDNEANDPNIPNVIHVGFDAANSVSTNVKNLVRAMQDSGVAEPERFVASGKTLQIIPTSTGEDISLDLGGMTGVAASK